MGYGKRRRLGRRIRAIGEALQPQAKRRARLGETCPPRGTEVYGDDYKTSRGLLSLQYSDNKLLRAEASRWSRPRERVRRSSPRRRNARWFLLLADGLASSRRSAVGERRGCAKTLR